MQVKAIIIYLLVGWFTAPVVGWIEKYIYSDWEFLKFLFVIVSVDTFLGLVKAVVQRKVSSKGFGMVLKKIIIYTSALITTSALTKFTVAGAPQVAFSFLGNVVFSAIMVREAISIFENIAEIDPGVLPGWILKYLQKFDSLTGQKLLDEN
ncbi:phage holin family protein [Chitinophaga sp. LS1]|uniref:phage holin family protein n=1 Tax=Chitinophaga sp. LS1 TaxID=3051176 RepID=UPI002AAC1429|nr:phage holin family protein [Chitinophaga sp. LS1]WPV66272.1 phage holin family protein [Chitinophaga sp. LS1]